MHSHTEWSELSDNDRQLLNLIESVIANPGGADHADHPLYDLCRQLVNAQPMLDPAFRQELEARLMTALTGPPDEGGKNRTIRAIALRPTIRQLRLILAGVLVAIGLSAVVIITYPPARAWAQGLLARFGPFVFTTGPTLPELALTRTPEPPTRTPQPTDQHPATEGVQGRNVMTLEEAQALVPFNILAPLYLPEGMHLSSLYVMPEGLQTVPDVSTTYVGEANGDVLIIRQFPYDGVLSTAEFPVGDAPVTEVTVRGQAGIWVEDANLGLNQSEDGTTELIKWSFLIWQEEQEGSHYLVWMFTHTLSQTDMLKIAESLAP